MPLGMLGKYEKLDVLGHGAFGIVYLARDTHLNKQVAIKVSRVLPADQEKRLEEARIMDRLKHPHIVTFHDVNVIENNIVLDMEYIEGQSLRDLLDAEKQLAIECACEITAHLLEALACAHSLNILHRDLKPENVLLHKEGTVKLADFSNARVLADNMYYAGGGTFPYMAPESLEEGNASDTRADVWSVGVLLYEMLTGQCPFQAAGQRTIQDWRIAVQVTPPTLHKFLPEVPTALQAIVNMALANDKRKRYASARPFLDEMLRTGLYQPPLSAEDHFRIEQFEAAYNRIDDHLRQHLTAEAKTPFVQLARAYARQHPQWRDLSELLRLNGIRRDLAHRHKQANEYRPIPSQREIANIEAIEQRLLATPPRRVVQQSSQPAPPRRSSRTARQNETIESPAQGTSQHPVGSFPNYAPVVHASPNVLEKPYTEVILSNASSNRHECAPALTEDGLHIIICDYHCNHNGAFERGVAQYNIYDGSKIGRVFDQEVKPKAITAAHGGGCAGMYENGNFAICNKWTNWKYQILSSLSFTERAEAWLTSIRQMRSMRKSVFIEGGRQLITCGHHLETWDFRSGKSIRKVALWDKISLFPHLNSGIFAIDSSGRYVVLQTDKRYHSGIVVCDLPTCRPLFPITSFGNVPTFSADGQYFACFTSDADYSSLKIWNVANKEIICKFVTERPYGCMAFSPDGRSILLTPYERSEIHLRDIQTGSLTHKIVSQSLGIDWISFSLDGREIIILERVKCGEVKTRISVWKL